MDSGESRRSDFPRPETTNIETRVKKGYKNLVYRFTKQQT
jgi:hypothetical protein